MSTDIPNQPESQPQSPETPKALAVVEKVTMELSQSKPIWEQQGPAEKDDMFAKFLIYKNLGHKRTLLEAEALSKGRKKTAHNSGGYHGLATKWRWIERAAAFDKHEQEKIGARLEKSRERYAEKIESVCHDLVDDVINFRESKFGTPEKRALGFNIMTLLGKGGAGNFLTSSYRTIVGEKHEVQVKVHKLRFE